MIRVQTTQVNQACEDCGKSPALKWSIAGVGKGVLCKACLEKVVAEINTALAEKPERR